MDSIPNSASTSEAEAWREGANGMRVAILQPTFLPWLGWFDIADQSDLLVILDDVAFSKQSWQQRNRLRTQKALDFVTVPVLTAGRFGQSISEVQLADPRFLRKLEGTVLANYSRTPFFGALYPEFRDVLHRAAGSGRLVDLNCILIDWFCTKLAVTTPMRRSSGISGVGKRGEYVASLCQAVGAVDYLSPAGAEAYLLEDRLAFERRGLQVWLHEYEHPEYRQAFQPFRPFASALDLLFNEGDESGAIMRSGRRPARPLGSSAAIATGEEYDER